MRFMALATDYDGTLATQGRVAPSTLSALERFKCSGRKLLLVTGRELPELREVFPHLGLFDRIVAENGALLYDPAFEEEKLLGKPAPKPFVEALKARQVRPLSVGRSIVATVRPHDEAIRETLAIQRLDREIIYNKEAVMVLPFGIDKESGLRAALTGLGLSPRHTVAIGDAENDLAFMNFCGCAAAVANALPGIQSRAHLVTEKPEGAGVAELIERIIRTDLAGTVSF